MGTDEGNAPGAGAQEAVVPASQRADRWVARDLVRSYVLASFPVLCLLTVGLGWWVTRSIEDQVIRNSAANLALYAQSFLAQTVQGLAHENTLSSNEIEAIERLLDDTPLGERIVALKVWKEGGRLAYHSRHEMIGQTFPPTLNMRLAWRGNVMAALDDLRDAEDREEARLGLTLLEVYSPLRKLGSDRVIAVVEFYQDAEPLVAQLRETRLRTWMVVVAATAMTFGLLLIIVQRGGRVIRLQRAELHAQVTQLRDLLARNRGLGTRLRRAARRTTTLTEQQLRRVSAEIHDGPAQSMSLALLRLDALVDPGDGEPKVHQDAVDEVRGALTSALTEIRQISRGLALPELDALTVRAVLERAVSGHTERTGGEPDLIVLGEEAAEPVSTAVKLTLYRVVQEALMNVHLHAGDEGARVRATLGTDAIEVTISDAGPGFDPDDLARGTDRLGLAGLRERVEASGGQFALSSGPGAGTRVHATLPLRVDASESAHG